MSIRKKKSKAKKAKAIKKGKRKMGFAIKRKTLKKRIAKTSSIMTSRRLWPEEERALEDIHTGKTKMIDVSGEDFLKEIKSVINEQTANRA